MFLPRLLQVSGPILRASNDSLNFFKFRVCICVWTSRREMFDMMFTIMKAPWYSFSSSGLLVIDDDGTCTQWGFKASLL